MSLSNSKIGVTVQEAHTLVTMIDAGTFPTSAFTGGRGQTFEEFKARVLKCIEDGTNSSLVIEQNLVAKWLAATAPEVHRAFLLEFPGPVL